MQNSQTELTEPKISVDRQSQKIAVFDGNFNCVRDFIPYTDEAAAVAEAKAWVKERCATEPEMVYPQITSMRMTYSKPRRSRR